MTIVDRRRFLRRSAAFAIAAPVALQGLALRGAFAAEDRALGRGQRVDGDYGPLIPSVDCPDLALPAGFHCRRLGETGTPMSDGVPTPGAHDGMAAYATPTGNARLVRNHELRGTPSAPF